LGHAQVEEAIQEISQLLKIDKKDVFKISAKQGIGIDKIMDAVIEKIPAPSGKQEASLRALIFDSIYDIYKGIIAYVRIVDGSVKAGDKISMFASKAQTEVIEVGFFKPQMLKTDFLNSGEIGYIATGLKSAEQCRVGDTITLSQGATIKPLAGYQEPRSVVFASFYPSEIDDYDLLKDSLTKLRLNDASLQYEPESCEGLGRGFRCGFLGMLHLEIILERLNREYKLNLITTSPSVKYKVITKEKKQLNIISITDLPESDRIDEMQEPWVSLEIITPSEHLGPVMKLLENTRSEYSDTHYLSAERVLLKYETPLNEIIVDFYDKLKNITSGYASMSYEFLGYRQADLVRMDIFVAGEKKDAFSRIVHREKVEKQGRALVKKLKEVIPSHLFAVSLQAVVSGNIIARETISAWRKDVTGYLYGGDYTRKRKLLEKQKKGKKRMKGTGKVNIPQDVFLKVLRK
ncbi:MAG: translation elongation factor 4, partial [bacterium]